MKLGKKTIIFPLLYMVIIFISSSIPGNASTAVSRFFQTINPDLQNLLHIPLYGGLTFLWIMSLRNWNIRHRKVLFLSFTIASGYSMLDEFHQYFVPGRFPSSTDVILNTVGIGFIILVHIIKYRIIP